MENAKIKISCRVSVDRLFRLYVDSTYEAFLALARELSPDCEVLTDSKAVSQLQDLYFLLKEGILKVTEEKGVGGGKVLFLEILALPE